MKIILMLYYDIIILWRSGVHYHLNTYLKFASYYIEFWNGLASAKIAKIPKYIHTHGHVKVVFMYGSHIILAKKMLCINM